MLLSLLYDEVLIQDEIFVCSQKMAGWFRDGETFRLLEELFAIGGITVLKRPLRRYPPQLQEKAQKNPIQARVEHLTKFSVGNTGEPLRFTNEQRQFHNRLESCLLASPRGHRDAGSKNALGEDLMQSFGNRLSEVLMDARYKRWRASKFPHISPQTGSEFVGFVQDPSEAIKRIKERTGQQPRFTLEGDSPVFSTALAVQAAASYQPDEANDLVSLIETVFAVPFCMDEDAVGRHSRTLRELPLPLDQPEGKREAGRVVKVETRVKVPVGLPRPEPGFAEALQRVRESSGKKLKNAMKRLGKEMDFHRQEEAWSEVKEELASQIADRRRMREFGVWSILGSIGHELIFDTIADFMLHPPRSTEECLSRLLVRSLGKGFSLTSGYVYELLRMDLQRQRISEKLESAVQFRCVDYPKVTGRGQLTKKDEGLR
jgi:hypothetical protein